LCAVLAPKAPSLSLILSYLALAGILTVGSASEDLLRAWIPDAARPALAASLGAFLATAAVSAACFGALRPVSLVASLALGPAATVLMVGSLSWLAAGAAFPAAAPAVAAALTAVWKANGAIAAAAARVPAIETPSALPVLGISLAVPGSRVWSISTQPCETALTPSVDRFGPPRCAVSGGGGFDAEEIRQNFLVNRAARERLVDA
jgi:hypothetical protein